MTTFTIRFKNETKHSYHFGVYQTLPLSPGLKSVVWKSEGVPSYGSAQVNWSLNYATAVTEWERNDTVCTGKQIVPATTGNIYRCGIVEGDIPSISPEGKPGRDGQIALINDTNKQLNLGLAIDGHVVATNLVGGGEGINFVVSAQYYVACYRGITQGQLVDMGVELGPVEVKFENGITSATVTAATEDFKNVLKTSFD